MPSLTATRKNSMNYTVSGTDSLESIAAAHDCTVGELMKLNRMSSRMVPFTSQDDVFETDALATSTPRYGNQIAGGESAADGIRKGPGGAVPAQQQRGSSLMKTQSAPLPGLDEADSDCLQRFLKIKVKQVTESDGTVSGTLLVTPNCLMFDPDVNHPLVKENGQDLYGMVANMDEIVSVSVYKEISALTGDKEDKKKDIFDPNHVRTPAMSVSQVSQQVPDDPVQEDPVKFSLFERSMSDGSTGAKTDEANDRTSTKAGSETFLPCIDEESQKSPDEDRRTRAISDVGAQEYAQVHSRNHSSTSSSQDASDRPRSYSELDAGHATGPGSRFSPNIARRSFGKLGRTLSARAKSIQGTVAQGTKQVAHGVVTHTKSAADSLQTGLETGVKVVGEAANAAANQAKAAADVVAGVPGRVVDMGTSLVSDGINGVQEIFNVDVEEQRTASQMKREQSLATLEGLKQRTQQARDDSVAKGKQNIFTCATSANEMPDVFLSVDEIIGRTLSTDETATESPALPYYMAVRLTRKKRKTRKSSPSYTSSVSSYDEDCAFGNKLKREFWYAIPRSKADNIYHFLLQWSPDKYGQVSWFCLTDCFTY
ncbi:LysM domain-containing protein [Trichostrongylus colubriformis]|uniref:LysM domain-containing protein n=1 Tax=Trichostrongylus colubriformis TaxID=6319 RepID=A0AAN8IRV6_TRICO